MVFLGSFFFIVQNLTFRYKVTCTPCLIIHRFYIFLIIYSFFGGGEGRRGFPITHLGDWSTSFKWGVCVCDKISFNLLTCYTCACTKLPLLSVSYTPGIVKKHTACNAQINQCYFCGWWSLVSAYKLLFQLFIRCVVGVPHCFRGCLYLQSNPSLLNAWGWKTTLSKTCRRCWCRKWK